MKKESAQKKAEDFSQRRRHMRYKPELGTVAFLSDSDDLKFTPMTSALVLDEAYKGCHLVLPLYESLQVGSRIRIQIAELDPLVAEIKWRTVLDDRVMRMGVMFLE